MSTNPIWVSPTWRQFWKLLWHMQLNGKTEGKTMTCAPTLQTLWFLDHSNWWLPGQCWSATSCQTVLYRKPSKDHDAQFQGCLLLSHTCYDSIGWCHCWDDSLNHSWKIPMWKWCLSKPAQEPLGGCSTQELWGWKSVTTAGQAEGAGKTERFIPHPFVTANPFTADPMVPCHSLPSCAGCSTLYATPASLNANDF